MRLYKRSDFLNLPSGTIYSRVEKDTDELMTGLFCKTSGMEMAGDWIEQNLIGEAGFPNEIVSGTDAIQHQLNLRDTFQDFNTDLDCGGRDAMFDETDVFVVWDKSDVQKLVNYLNEAIECYE